MPKDTGYRPYIDPKTNLKELTLPPLVLGCLLAIVLGAANVYLGLKAGMTVAATFPAAVLSMAVLRLLKGNILEENIARTTGAVGEALAAGAIFTVPAFLIVGVWDSIDLFSANWFLATALLAVGGVLGVLFVILLRRTFVEDASLPFPESQACTEIVKAGQGGQSGAGVLFGSMGLAGFFEFLRHPSGVPLIGGNLESAFRLGRGIFPIYTPAPSPAFLAVGNIIGPKYGAITASGGIFGWLFLMPILLYMMVSGDAGLAATLSDLVDKGEFRTLFAGAAEGEGFPGLKSLYADNIKMIAIGAMIVGAFFTLFKMRSNLGAGLKRSFTSFGGAKGGSEELRTDKDLNIKVVLLAVLAMVGAMWILYTILCGSTSVSLVMTVVMAIAGFLFAAVAGFLVSIIGSSSNPISGLTLSTLLLAAGLLVLLGMGGGYLEDGKTMGEAMKTGVLAVLGVATVVCCVAGVAGDMAQDWKVGYNLGGTPWRMEVGGIIGVIAASLVLVLVITLLHQSDIAIGGRGIGGDALPAPQAGLMAVMAKGIISGALRWELILIGMFFALALIFIGAPSPMLIAVGMYLPFNTTGAIFLGGIVKWVTDVLVKRQKIGNERVVEAISNKALLVSSGFVAGEALMGLVLAGLVAAGARIFDSALLSTGVGQATGGLAILFLAGFMIERSLSAVHDRLPEAKPPGADAASGGAEGADRGAEGPYRDKVEAAAARVKAVEDELAQARKQLEDLEGEKKE
jgi:putative OPT family oligopeptide transporter